MSLGLLRGGDIIIDLEAKVAEIAACPIKTEQVRGAILGAMRSIALEEVGRRRLSSPVEKKKSFDRSR
jgi:hypothetical protein